MYARASELDYNTSKVLRSSSTSLATALLLDSVAPAGLLILELRPDFDKSFRESHGILPWFVGLRQQTGARKPEVNCRLKVYRSPGSNNIHALYRHALYFVIYIYMHGTHDVHVYVLYTRVTI